MSLLTPERVSVKVYKWDDEGAPALQRGTSNSVAIIFKACLVTGYGTKSGAGWTMPFEDTVNGIKVFRPELGAETDFFLQISNDNGRQADAAVYQNMTDATTGDLKLKCDKQFKYARGTVSGKWVMVVSPRGIWFFCEQSYRLTDTSLSGAYFFAGDTMRDEQGLRSIYLQHTGGNYNDGDYSDIFGRYNSLNLTPVKSASEYVYGKLLDGDTVYTCDTESQFDAISTLTNATILSRLLIITNKKMYQLPGLTSTSDGAIRPNFTTQQIAMDGYASDTIIFSTGANVASNFCLSTDTWSY